VSPGAEQAVAAGGFDPYAVRREFPILNERVNGRRLVWLDNAPPPRNRRPSSIGCRISTRTRIPTFTGRPHPGGPGNRCLRECPEPLWPAFWARPAHETSCSCAGPPRPSNLGVAQRLGRAIRVAGDEIVIHPSRTPRPISLALGAQKNKSIMAPSVPAPLRRIYVLRSHERARRVPRRSTIGGEVILEAYAKLLCSRTKMVAAD